MMKNTKLIKPKFALVSVSDKEGIENICKTLCHNYGVTIISTGGTYKMLCNILKSGFEVIEISEFTNSPEIMDGRVKTLHPKIHAGLLCDSDKQNHLEDLKTIDTTKIDIVIVNLYPFYETVQKGLSEEEIIENIDIGGPSMIRSAAKNFKHTAIITHKNDYSVLIENLKQNNGSTDFNLRFNLAKKAFLHTAYYDSIISNYLNKDENFFELEQVTVPLTLSQKLRYGENPQQKANFYKIALSSGLLSNFEQLWGKELSYNNINDSLSAIESVIYFSENNKKAVCIVKHNNPCCFAVNNSEILAYKNAILNGDSQSAFGGIVAVNGTVDENFAKEFVKIFYEVLICFEITPEALEIIKSKKNVRVLILKQTQNNNSILNGLKIKIDNGVALVQTVDNFKVLEHNIINNNGFLQEQINQFLFSIGLVKFISSNAICITYNNSLIAIGSGQTSRVDAVKIACQKAQQKCKELNIDISQTTLASDAFFPFSDNIEVISSYGIKNVIAPSGSVKDQEVIEVSNKLGINLAFVPNRFFRH